jgi:hypothetical protein
MLKLKEVKLLQPDSIAGVNGLVIRSEKLDALYIHEESLMVIAVGKATGGRDKGTSVVYGIPPTAYKNVVFDEQPQKCHTDKPMPDPAPVEDEPEPKECAGCSQPFVPTHHSQKYCSACQEQRKKG